MPRKQGRELTKHEHARVVAKRDKVTFDVAYHLIILANQADGRPSRGFTNQVPAIDDLPAEDKANLARLRAELGL